MKAPIGTVAVRMKRVHGCMRYLEVTLILFEESEVMNPGWQENQ